MERTWALTAVLAIWAAAGGVWASTVEDLRAEHRAIDLPVDRVVDLPAEHRAHDFTDLLSKLPIATSNMFIWNHPDGSYRFGMQGDDQWRVESRDADGTVKGRYSYQTPEGQVVDITYDAGPQGYRARGGAIPGGASLLQQQTPEESPLVPTRYSQQSGGELSDYYGALLYVDVEKTLPSGDGVTTFADDDNVAIVTDVRLQQLQEGPVAVFPVGFLPGSTLQLAGPPFVNDSPVQPAAIPV